MKVYLGYCPGVGKTCRMLEDGHCLRSEGVDVVVGLDNPRFLGVLFLQHDPDAKKAEYEDVLFVWPFLNGPEDAARLLHARQRQLELTRKAN